MYIGDSEKQEEDLQRIKLEKNTHLALSASVINSLN